MPLDILKDRPAILAVLNAVILQKARFRIRMNNRGRSFNSSLVRLDYPYLLIDALFPFEGNEIIDESEFITADFVIEENGRIPYTFRSKYIRKEQVDGYEALRIEFPEAIKRDQKRYYHRITPHVNEKTYVEFIINNESVREKIANISGGGLGFYTNLRSDVLWPGKRLSPVYIFLNGTTVKSSMAVVNLMHQADIPVLINGRPRHYYCGAEFLDIDEKMRSKIIKYVVNSERKYLKRLSRGFE